MAPGAEDSVGTECSPRIQGHIQEEQFTFSEPGKKVSASLVGKNLAPERRFLLPHRPASSPEKNATFFSFVKFQKDTFLKETPGFSLLPSGKSKAPGEAEEECGF